jgi:hypothetical protein
MRQNDAFDAMRPHSAPVGLGDAGLNDNNSSQRRYHYLHTYDANGRALPIRRRGRQGEMNRRDGMRSKDKGVLKRYAQLCDRAATGGGRNEHGLLPPHAHAASPSPSQTLAGGGSRWSSDIYSTKSTKGRFGNKPGAKSTTARRKVRRGLANTPVSLDQRPHTAL